MSWGRGGHATRTGNGGLTGTTVVPAPEGGAVAAVDVRGGGPGTTETDALDPRNPVQKVEAIVLTGGSAYGLDAASGVTAWPEEQRRGVGVDPAHVVPVVPAACVFDLGRGGDFRARPDAATGRAAVEAAAASEAGSSVPLPTARTAGTDLAGKVGCGSARDVLTCLRRVHVSRLLAAQDTDQQPAYGTPLLPGAPAAALATGRFHRVPVLIGNNHDEGNGWAAGIVQAGNPVTPDTWSRHRGHLLPLPGAGEGDRPRVPGAPHRRRPGVRRSHRRRELRVPHRAHQQPAHHPSARVVLRVRRRAPPAARPGHTAVPARRTARE
nr:P1 family peptidase [Streptomyces aquilus]